jgi:hypothetical protein
VRRVCSSVSLHPLASITLLLLATSLVTSSPAGGRSVDIPRPILPSPTGPPGVDPSSVLVPIQISLSFIADALEPAVPEEIGTNGEFAGYRDHVEINYEVWRDQFTLDLSGDTLRVRTDFHYWLEARGSEFDPVSCGSPSEPMHGKITSLYRLGWLDDWSLDVRLDQTPTGYRRRCKPKPPGINFTKPVNTAIRTQLVGPLESSTQEAVEGSKVLRAELEKAWIALQEPVALGLTDMWLEFRPMGIVSDPIAGVGDEVSVKMAILVAPRMKVGDPPAATVATLPQTRVRLPESELRIAFDCGVTLEDLSEQIQEQCSSITQEGLSSSIEIASVNVFGGEDQIAVALTLEGEIDGVIYLAGSATYDAGSRFISVAGIDYTQETRQELFGAPGVNEDSLHVALERLRVSVEDALKSDVGPGVAAYLGQVGLGLNRRLTDKVAIQGGMNERRTMGVFVTEKVLGVRLLAVGKASLIVQ